MRSYPFIKDLFTNVLQKSKAIGGRFYVCPKYGVEINSDQLGEVLTTTQTPGAVGPKYPLALMMPPRSSGNFSMRKEEWKTYRIVMFFLKTSYFDSNNKISNLNIYTQTSQHTIPEDWHDMERSAVNFIRVLDELQRTKMTITSSFRLVPGDKIITPVSQIGVDGASGVKLEFAASLFVGCELEDYLQEDISLITLPVADSHPEHQL